MRQEGLKILLIEDEPDYAAFIGEMLGDPLSDIVVWTADRLSSGMALIDKDLFDIVLLDLGLPDSIGLDALRKIQILAPKLPVVILTGQAAHETAEEALLAGAQDYLVKGDIDRKLILRSIHYAMQRKQAREALERAHDELELRVLKGTAELSVYNAELTAEIAERKLAQDELTSSHEQLRELAVHLQSVREEERANIAREIHDELGQALTALKMDLFWIRSRLQDNQKLLFEKVGADMDLIDSTIGSVKRLCTELRPAILDNLGLESAIEWQAEEFQKRTDINCSVDLRLKDPVNNQQLKTALFRIFQEILTNVMRHARATSVSVALLGSDSRVILEVCDNGIGIEPGQLSKANSFGLMGMRERVFPWGGRIEIRSAKNRGTTVTAIIPMACREARI